MFKENRNTADLDRASDAPSVRRPFVPRWTGVFAVTFVAATLAACGSNVKLDDVPVEDRSSMVSTLPQAPGTTGTGAAVDQRGVSGVEVAGGDVAQPTAMVRTVYFDYDSFVVRPEFAATLEAHAKYLAANSRLRVALEGHTDERGGREYNLALGQKRGEAVRRALSLLGVNEAQMEAVSFGEEKPAVVGFDEAAFAKNRRVELTYR
ncbi:MAG: peptidoglycan-associated lipoprotein Pal [Hydrogenophaga sp.]|jgi:peptidoglycan-associated lipoprotein|uniref:peptidoglycan-associated lipoprotein Pal n=1 Tax=Hydrogenophaga sp. TaxID=1904254 RepID=UPI0027311445|nr:peptidoglycan-associated lipoprotein Pal [Hydrogenophaga sp.]MDP2164846.1 peptidoglycan-associated lipoprotein Pal [Hydrogenophaga sp.]MDZ4237659.1 peptidoglycan-associated lipoprotein Pal [Hydrogenophaga sp.]